MAQAEGNSRSDGLSAAERELCAVVSSCADDPLGFVRVFFPWGKKGTRLEKETGPDTWQANVLKALGEDVRKGLRVTDASATAIQYAVSSGHGPGKTCLVAWIIIWFVSCFELSQTVVTANTRTQLLTKTWRELAKWHALSIHKHWFKWTATQFKSTLYPEQWFASAISWSDTSAEAFAGTHEKFVMVIFDEASTIADSIWEVTEGAMTTPSAIWLAFGNPTKNTGRFAECFGSGRHAHRWRTWHVDSRTAKMANKAQIQQWIDDYGEDSDFVRIRVRGVFPRAGSNQLISSEAVRQAMARRVEPMWTQAKVMGVDIARHGHNQSCTIKRQGQWTSKAKRYRIADLMALAATFSEEIHEWKPDAVFLDVTGMGWGVYDRLMQLVDPRILYPVQVGESATEPRAFYNRRAELWWRMRNWINAGGCLEPDPDMEADLISPEYGYDVAERVQLEKKEDMEQRGLDSPDSADALALTFFTSVQPRASRPESWMDQVPARAGGGPGFNRSPETA